MYRFFHISESIVRRFYNGFLKNYWRLKYGKRIHFGKNIKFRKGLRININEKGYLEIGNNTFFNNGCSINVHEKVIIGNNNLFGEGVKVYDHNHVFNSSLKKLRTSFNSHPIIIGNNNWFASNVVLLSKAKVGDNNVFGANTIINMAYGSNNLVMINKKTQTIDKIVRKF